MVDSENNRTTYSIVLVKLFRLRRRLCANYIDYEVEYPRGHVSCWPDLVIKSTVEPNAVLSLTSVKLA